MTPTEKLLIIGYGILSGIAIYYIRKSKRLESIIEAQKDSIDIMKDFIESIEK